MHMYNIILILGYLRVACVLYFLFFFPMICFMVQNYNYQQLATNDADGNPSPCEGCDLWKRIRIQYHWETLKKFSGSHLRIIHQSRYIDSTNLLDSLLPFIPRVNFS